MRACSSSGSHLPRTAVIAPDACSRAIDQATGSTARTIRAGFANQPSSTARDDGLELTDAYVSTIVRCAPPDNKPLPAERDRCIGFFVRELGLLHRVTSIIALGAFAWDGVLRATRELGHEIPKPRPAFGHGATMRVGPYTVFGSYHVSQQNTFTGRLTEPMLDAVFVSSALGDPRAASPSCSGLSA